MLKTTRCVPMILYADSNASVRRDSPQNGPLLAVQSRAKRIRGRVKRKYTAEFVRTRHIPGKTELDVSALSVPSRGHRSVFQTRSALFPLPSKWNTRAGMEFDRFEVN